MKTTEQSKNQQRIEQERKNEEQRHQLRLAQIKAIAPFVEQLDAIPVEVDFCGDFIDFNWPSHEIAVKIMQILNVGKWNKQYESHTGRVTYTAKLQDTPIRIYQGKPPPNCRVIRETVLVPAETIPAHEETVTRMICNEDLNSTDTETPTT